MLYYLVDGSEVGGGGGAWNTGVPVTGVFLFTGDCITHTHRHTERETDTHGDLNRTTAIALTELDTIRNASIRSTHRL